MPDFAFHNSFRTKIGLATDGGVVTGANGPPESLRQIRGNSLQKRSKGWLLPNWPRFDPQDGCKNTRIRPVPLSDIELRTTADSRHGIPSQVPWPACAHEVQGRPFQE